MQNNPFPFVDLDVTKYFAEFRAPTFDVNAIIAAHRKNVEAITAANRCAFEGASALMRRQGEIAREAIEFSSAAFNELATQGPFEDKAARQTELARSAYDVGVANARELTDIFVKTQDETFGVINNRVRESLGEIQGLVAGAAKTVEKTVGDVQEAVADSGKAAASTTTKPAAPKK